MPNVQCDVPAKEFEVVTDPERMKEVFQHLPAFSQKAFLITGCTLVRTQYRERTRRRSSLTVCYRLQVTDICSNKQAERTLYARTYLAGRSRSKFQHVKASMVSSPPPGDVLGHIPDLDAIVWTFPHDPRLSHLPQVIDPEGVKSYLPYDLLPSGLDAAEDVSALSVETIQYLPEDRCTVRYHLQWRPSDTCSKTLTIFGKMFKDTRGREIYRRHEHLWKTAIKNPEGFMVAQPLGYNDSAQLMWQEGLPGVPLADTIDRTNCKDFLDSVARGLASLHESGLSSPVKKTIQDRLRQVRKRTTRVIQAFPFFKESLQSIVRELENSALHLTPTTTGFIHGDFHIKQLLIHKDRVGICDYDDFANGDPAQDIATFIVDLIFRDLDPDFIDMISTTLWHSYSSHIAWTMPVDRMRWQIRIEFIRKLYRLFFRRFLRPGFEGYMQQIIAIAQKEINPDTDIGALADQVAKIRAMGNP